MSDFASYETPINEAKALPVMLTGKLVGRETALSQVYADLQTGNVVLIHGTSGTGKTGLAATLAAAYTQQPGGVLWFSINNPSLEELLVRVGRAYNVTEIVNTANPIGMIGAVENTLKSNKPLLVLDGEIQPEIAQRFVSRCVTGTPALIISEQKLEGPWKTQAITSLEAGDAAALFKRESRLTTDEHDIDIYGLIKLVDYNPFGIIVMARGMLASKKTPGEYFNILKQIAKVSGNGPVVALTASFRALQGALQGLLLHMGATFNGKVSTELLSVIASAPVESVQKALNMFTQLHLIERIPRAGSAYYQLHPIAYQFAQSWLTGSNQLDALQEKVRKAIIAYAQKFSTGQAEDNKRLAFDMESFMATARWAANKDDHEIASELVNAFNDAGNFISSGGYLLEQIQLRALAGGSSQPFPAYDTSLTPSLDDDEDYEEDEDEIAPEDLLMDAFDDTDDDGLDDHVERSLEATFVSNVEEDDSGQFKVPVSTEVDLTTRDLSKLRSALALTRQSGDTTQQIAALKAIGTVQVEQGMENEAIATYDELLTVYETMDDKMGALETLDMLSALMAKTENSQAAVMHAQRGLKFVDDLNDEETKMHLLSTLGDARQQLGESDTSAGDYSEALAIARKREDSQNEAIILYKLGFAQLDDGYAETAIDTWEQALKLFKSQDKRDYEGRTLGGLGSACGDLERWSEAVNYHTSSLHIAREVGDREEESLQLGSLAYAATKANQLGEAVLRYRQSLHLAYEADNVDNIVSTIVDLSRLLLISRRHVTVAELLVNDAFDLDPTDKDLKQLQERISSEKALAQSYGTQMIDTSDRTAREYAHNAYNLFEA